MKEAGSERVVRELEPSAAKLLERHLAVSREWFPHQFVPWSQGSDFDGPLGGVAWDPGQSALPEAVQDSLVLNLLTEDNLPGYHLEIATRFGRDGAWGTWVHRWTAEEGRHADALRAFLHARRAVDPIALERLRMRQVSTGYRSDLPTVLHFLAYATVQELATREIHRNAGSACGDPVAETLMARIAADENLHMLFYRGLYADALRAFPDQALAALADVLRDFEMPPVAIPGFRSRALRVAASGIFNYEVHCAQVVLPLLRTLGVLSVAGLGPDGARAQESIGDHVERLRGLARRARALCERVREAGKTA